ncbi:MAG: N-acetylmuramoyl-L-alanine amidase [Desulfobacterales bacterium]|jgi:N-acetylmuramoyl-L-alanine amidase
MYKNKMFRVTAQVPESIKRHRLPHQPAATKRVSRIALITAIGLGLIIYAATPEAEAKRRFFEAQLPVVAIDPGHGGKDPGAKGPDGAMEKAVTLNLARMLAHHLNSDFRVVLTRDDDYGLDNSDRTAAANHARADIFISLHTGNSFSHASNRSAVYFYEPFQGSAFRTESKSPRSSAVGEPALRWNIIQTKHRVASKKLAMKLKAGLASIWQAQEVTVRGAPMLVLEGADMPAVAVEIGNLANASSEKQLADPRYLSEIAGAIARAITAFLAEQPK